MRTYAVLTGDLVRSSRLAGGELERAGGALEEAVAELAVAPWAGDGLMVGELDRFRGDAWQLLLADPGQALRAAVFLRVSLLVQGLADTRVAIGIGPVETIARERISLSGGPAFELSGTALDAMGPRFRLALAAAPEIGLPGPWAQAVVHLCDSVMGQWQGRQIETARLALLHPEASHEELGAWLEPAVTQQAVSKSLHSAGWHGLAEALALFEGEAGPGPQKNNLLKL